MATKFGTDFVEIRSFCPDFTYLNEFYENSERIFGETIVTKISGYFALILKTLITLANRLRELRTSFRNILEH